MLQAEAQRHARNELMLGFPARHDLRSPDDEVMQQHAADDGEDHAEIKAANPADSFAADVGGKRGIHVDFGGGKFFRYAGMALAAGFRQILRVDRRLWIGRRQDIVHAMATGAIGHRLGAGFRGQPVE